MTLPWLGSNPYHTELLTPRVSWITPRRHSTFSCNKPIHRSFCLLEQKIWEGLANLRKISFSEFKLKRIRLQSLPIYRKRKLVPNKYAFGFSFFWDSFSSYNKKLHPDCLMHPVTLQYQINGGWTWIHVCAGLYYIKQQKKLSQLLQKQIISNDQNIFDIKESGQPRKRHKRHRKEQQGTT